MKKIKYKAMRSVLGRFAFVLAVPFVFSLSSIPALAGSCDEAKRLAGDVHIAWDAYKAGRISRNAYDRTYAHFMRLKQHCLANKASSGGGNRTEKDRVPVVSTSVRPSSLPKQGDKSIPYKLHGKYYYIEVSGTIGLRAGNPSWTGYRASDRASADACYEFNFSRFPDSDPIKIPKERYIFKNSGGRDVCDGNPYNPDHVYRSKPFFSKRSYRFWVDTSGYSDKYFSNVTGGMLHVNMYEFDGN